MKFQTLSLNPLVVVVDDLFDADLASHIIGLGREGIERALVVDKDGGNKVDEARTNSSFKLNQWTDGPLTEFTGKLSDIVRLPPENSEPAVLLHYVGDQEFKPHPDAFGTHRGGMEARSSGGQRLFTTICYLNEVATGGETEFPELKIRIKPKLGRVLIFGNTRLGTAEAHPHSYHAGRPVGGGEKWAMTHWWRQLAYHKHRDFPPESHDTIEI